MAKGTSATEERQRWVAETFGPGSHVERLNVGGSSHGSISDKGARGHLDTYFSLHSSEECVTPITSELVKTTRQELARFFYENGIPFHVARSPSFISAARALGNFGPGLTLPTPYDLAVPLLEEEKKSIDRIINDVKLTWAKTGVSIISDGWKDIRGRQLINFFVNNPNGTVFLKTIDASNAVKTGQLLFEMLDAIVEEVGERLVVQVVTDNASNYVAAGKLLMEKRKGLFWSPCAVHCIDLILEKIGDLLQHKIVLRKAKKVTKFIYNHGFVLAMLRAQVKRDLIRPASTRFCTAYLTLQRMVDLKQPLQSMFASVEWSKSIYSKTAEGKKVKKVVMDDDGFWQDVEYAVKITKPLFKVLRMIDSEKMPVMGFLYAEMEKAKDEIQASLDNDVGTYKEIITIIDSKWENQMNWPLHAAACMLNPHFYYSSTWALPLRMRNAINDAADRLVSNAKNQLEMNLQLDSFKNKKGIFSRQLCKLSATCRPPAEWWVAYGNDTPELQTFAIKVLSLTCSSSACERKWSTFNQIHTKKRNQLTVEKMNSLAYVMYNRKLRERHMKRTFLGDDEEEETVGVDEIPSDDEWIAPDSDDNDDECFVSEASLAVTFGGESSRLESQLESATQGSQWEDSTHNAPKKIYVRKRKNAKNASLTLDKGK